MFEYICQNLYDIRLCLNVSDKFGVHSVLHLYIILDNCDGICSIKLIMFGENKLLAVEGRRHDIQKFTELWMK